MNALVSMTSSAQPVFPTRRILSVTGGGLLGVIPAAFLERYEALGKQAYGPAYRLYQSFDLVGGVSTGAVVATAIALGMQARDITAFYLTDAPDVFGRPRRRLPGFAPRLDANRLQAHFRRCTGDARMQRRDLKTHLGALVKDVDGARSVLLTTLPQTNRILGADQCAAPVLLDDVLRASTAAPGLFAPKMLPIGPDGTNVTCIDGAVSACWDPALQLWSASLGLRQDGTSHLLSLGTGATTATVAPGASRRRPAFMLGLKGLKQVLRDAARLSSDVLTHLAQTDPRLCRDHYDMPLDRETLTRLGGMQPGVSLRQIRDFADVTGKHALYRAARRHAEAVVHRALPLRADLCADAVASAPRPSFGPVLHPQSAAHPV